MKTAEAKIPLPKILNGASGGKLLALIVGNIRARLVPYRKSTAEYSGSETIKSAIHDPDERDKGSSGTSDRQWDLTSTESDTDCDHSWIEDSGSILRRIIPLSSSQAQSWATLPHVEGGTGLDRSLSARINGHLRIDDLKSAVLAMGQQHEALRTCFTKRDGIPMQAIKATSGKQIRHLDEFEKAAKDDQRHVFDIDSSRRDRNIGAPQSLPEGALSQSRFFQAHT